MNWKHCLVLYLIVDGYTGFGVLSEAFDAFLVANEVSIGYARKISGPSRIAKMITALEDAGLIRRAPYRLTGLGEKVYQQLISDESWQNWPIGWNMNSHQQVYVEHRLQTFVVEESEDGEEN